MINLSFSPSQVGGQNMANSAGKPIRFGNGKVYYPMPEYGPPGVRAAAPARAPVMMAAPRMTGAATRATYNPTVGGAWGSGQNTGPGSPGWSPGVITHDWNNTSGSDAFGNSMSFQPASVQTSSRWNTGY
jgi:hypothetical protein